MLHHENGPLAHILDLRDEDGIIFKGDIDMKGKGREGSCSCRSRCGNIGCTTKETG